MAEQWDFQVGQSGFGISVGGYNQEQKFVGVRGTHPQLCWIQKDATCKHLNYTWGVLNDLLGGYPYHSVF